MTAKTYSLNVTLTDTGKLSKKQNHARYEYNDEASGLHVIAWIPITSRPATVSKTAKTPKSGTPATQTTAVQPAVDESALSAKITANVMAALEKMLAK